MTNIRTFLRRFSGLSLDASKDMSADCPSDQSAGWCREAEAARVASLRPLVLFLYIGRAEYELRLTIGEVLSTNAVELCHHAKNTIGQFRDTVE